MSNVFALSEESGATGEPRKAPPRPPFGAVAVSLHRSVA